MVRTASWGGRNLPLGGMTQSLGMGWDFPGFLSAVLDQESTEHPQGVSRELGALVTSNVLFFWYGICRTSISSRLEESCGKHMCY